MRLRSLLIVASVAAGLAVAFLGPGASVSQAANPCLAAKSDPVDFGVRGAGVHFLPGEIKNECLEDVQIDKEFFGGDPSIALVFGCFKAKIPKGNFCKPQFAFTPVEAGKFTASYKVEYTVGGKEGFEYVLGISGEMQKGWNIPGPIEMAGELSLQGSGVTITCGVLSAGEIWNEGEGEALGEISSFVVSAPCATNLPGCEMVEGGGENLPWSMQVTENESGEFFDELSGVKVFYVPGASCAKYGLPAVIWATGSVTGLFDNSTSCLEFSAASGLKLFGSTPATLSGQDCIIEPEGVELG